MADKSMDGLNTFTAQDDGVAVDTSKKMRIGIIGCGWIAGSHMKSYLNQPDVEIVAGADLVPGKAKAFMEKYGVEGAKTDTLLTRRCLRIRASILTLYLSVPTTASTHSPLSTR